jgi:flagellar P-ring protein FlgI
MVVVWFLGAHLQNIRYFSEVFMKPLFGIFLFLFFAVTARADRLKDLVEIDGVRENALLGYGIVVGLAGTGDDASSPVTRRSLASMMKQLGVTIDPAEIKAKNVAAVIVTTKLPPFASPGMSLDVTISSIGTARGLQGGTLLLTPLKGADLKTYALAQGPLAVGGFAFEAAAGSTQKNHPTVGHIPSGASVEMAAPGALSESSLSLLLKKPDFTTASRIAASINQALGEGSAQVKNSGVILMSIKADWQGKTAELIATLEALEATPDEEAKVVIDEKTGTIVVGQFVTLSPASIVYGGLQVEISERKEVSQPGPLSKGETTTTPASEINVQQESGSMHLIPKATSVADVAAALNLLGVKPRDLIAILRALKAAGSLHADLEVL